MLSRAFADRFHDDETMSDVAPNATPLKNCVRPSRKLASHLRVGAREQLAVRRADGGRGARPAGDRLEVLRIVLPGDLEGLIEAQGRARRSLGEGSRGSAEEHAEEEQHTRQQAHRLEVL